MRSSITVTRSCSGLSASGSARSAASTATPSSTASRASQRSRQWESISGVGGAASGGAAGTHGHQVPALHEADERLAQRRAGDAELLAQVALGRQARARRQQAELDRRAEA